MPEFKGRPGSAGQRPTGGDKAVATQKKAYFRRKKVCRFCVEKIDDINYKDTKLLHAFVAERGKIVPISPCCRMPRSLSASRSLRVSIGTLAAFGPEGRMDDPVTMKTHTTG